MHSRIFEISRYPINRKERIKAYDLPEWFCHEIADYVDDLGESEREDSLSWFEAHFGEACKRVGDKISFADGVKEKFFAARYKVFISSLSAAVCTLKDFSGENQESDLPMNMYRLKESYEDRFGFYIYDHDMEELMTLDSWVRRFDLTKDYYFGSAIDYHF